MQDRSSQVVLGLSGGATASISGLYKGLFRLSSSP